MAAGFRFWPVVHETQGGMATAAHAAVRAIAAAVAAKERREAASVRRELLSRVAAVVARCTTRAIKKRTAPKLAGNVPTAVRQIMRDTDAHEEV